MDVRKFCGWVTPAWWLNGYSESIGAVKRLSSGLRNAAAATATILPGFSKGGMDLADVAEGIERAILVT
jgi:hypothetical protein